MQNETCYLISIKIGFSVYFHESCISMNFICSLSFSWSWSNQEEKMKEIVHLLEIMQTTDPGDEVVASCSKDSSPQPSTSSFQQTVVKNSSSLPVQSESSNNVVRTPKKRKRNTLDKVWKYTSRKNQRWNKVS